LAGWIPGIGEAADLINAGLYALEGDWVNAGISALGIIPGLGDAAKAGRMGKRAKNLAKEWLPSNALYNRGGSKAPRLFRPTYEDCLYQIGPYGELTRMKRGISGLDAHHVPQAHLASQVIPGYNRDTGPAIIIPEKVHHSISHKRGIFSGTLLDIIELGLNELLQNGIPKEHLERLYEYLRRLYGL
jgi:hypothetical protein